MKKAPMKQPQPCCVYCSFKSDRLRLIALIARNIRIVLVSASAIATAPNLLESSLRAYVSAASARAGSAHVQQRQAQRPVEEDSLARRLKPPGQAAPNGWGARVPDRAGARAGEAHS